MLAGTIEEKRRFQRILYNAEAVLAYGDTAVPCRIVDLSLKGCLLEFDQPWSSAIDSLYFLSLTLSDEVSIGMKLRFAHGVGPLAGFSCDHIDIDSMTNLRRLVELNLGDSEILGRELNVLSHL